VTRKGKPNFEPTKAQRDQVEMYAAVGITHVQIAMLIMGENGEPISVDTLKRHFSPELDIGLAKVKSLIAGKVVGMALASPGPNGASDATAADRLRAAMFFLNTRGGWATNENVNDTRGEEDDGDETAIAARIAGLIERARRKAEKDKPPTVQ
jgi:hypothetical protein